MENTKDVKIDKEKIDKEKIDKEKIDLNFSIPESDTAKESDKKRIDVMDEKVAEGVPERPTQEDGGKPE